MAGANKSTSREAVKLELEQFWKEARAGQQLFGWVNLNDGNVCPDCLAIALQQKREGYTWDEWISFGMPKAGHTVCRGHCRCALVPYLYVDTSTELQGMSIMAEGDLPERTQRIVGMVEQWLDAGQAVDDLELMGLSETAQEEYLKKMLISKGIS